MTHLEPDEARAMLVLVKSAEVTLERIKSRLRVLSAVAPTFGFPDVSRVLEGIDECVGDMKQLAKIVERLGRK